jgi:meso-butanediol dehydrogenase/(S,S)-butanediol dehydrogenase/diacetyl reductase
MLGRFENKVVLITGAASGIGAASARRFAAEGARLALGDLNEAGCAKVARELDPSGARVLARALDVRELEAVEAFTRAAVERFGRLDVLFNNAGIGTFGLVPEMDPKVWRDIIDVDLNSVYYGCRAAIPHLVAGGGGAIVNTASISGLGGDYGLAAYNAAKGAVVNLTRSLALDHARDGIRTNAVCPGPIETALTAPMLGIPALMEEYRRLLPMGRMGTADEVAAAVAFLASDDAAYVNGVSLAVDGGVTCWTGQNNFTRVFQSLAGGGAVE